MMAGYFKDEAATGSAYAGGRLNTGDLAVRHPDGCIEIKDRAKDVIISGGENISSLEVEGVLHQHPAVLLAAVVALPDDKWGEVPWCLPGAEDRPRRARRRRSRGFLPRAACGLQGAAPLRVR
jgi:acyl-CoA synthetase (AMP-forming)/AMP-acid ligase II